MSLLTLTACKRPSQVLQRAIPWVLVVIVAVLFGCQKETEKPGEQVPPAPATEYTLNYSAGEKGSIRGEKTQVVERGGSGTSVTAVADKGYQFERWSDGVTANPRTDTQVTEDLSVRAEFMPEEYSLSYEAGAHGRIEGEPTQKILYGESANAVTAVADKGYHFERWSDGVSANPRKDTDVSSDFSVTAQFAADQYSVQYSAGANGSIKGEKTQRVKHAQDASAVTAVAQPGYHFEQWSDGSIANPRIDKEITSDLEVSAEFAINQYTLNYKAGDHGTLEGQSKQSVKHGNSGTAVQAVAEKGYHFTTWSDGVGDKARTDKDVTSDISVTAEFAPDQYTLRYSAGPNGSIEGPANQTVSHGRGGAAVTAVAEKGYHFESWSDGSRSNPRIDTNVKSDLEVSAEFTINTYTLSYEAAQNGSIEGPGTQRVTHGEDGKAVTAVAAPGHHFERWSDGVESPTRHATQVTTDISAKAFFVPNTYALGGTLSGLAEENELVLQINDQEQLVLQENGAFRFTEELPYGQSYEVRVATQPTSPNQTCTVQGATGTIADSDIEDIVVECVINTYTLGGEVANLPEGARLVLRDNRENSEEILSNGPFSFAQPFEDGSAYEVTIQQQELPPKWSCRIENGAGVIAGEDVTTIDIACFPQAELRAEGHIGAGRIDLNWNQEDFKEVIFNLCRSRELIAEEESDFCPDSKGATVKEKITSPHRLKNVPYDVPYWFQLQVVYQNGLETRSNVVVASCYAGINDTGVDWCADEDGNGALKRTIREKKAGCEEAAGTHPGQDALNGRDYRALMGELEKDGAGAAGFDLTKVCMDGRRAGEGRCPPNPLLGDDRREWACTQDNVTGLMWEIKSRSGLRSSSHTYSWFNPEEKSSGGSLGVKNAGKCTGSRCDTAAYVAAVNAQGLCDANDWRLPTREELLSIVDNGGINPAVDERYFENTPAGRFWSSSASAEEAEAAWQVYFRHGESATSPKKKDFHVRLVRQVK